MRPIYTPSDYLLTKTTTRPFRTAASYRYRYSILGWGHLGVYPQSSEVTARKCNREPAGTLRFDRLLAIDELHPPQTMRAYATSLGHGGRIDRWLARLAIGPRLASGRQPQTVEEPSLARLYDTNMMNHVLHPSPDSAFAVVVAEAPARSRLSCSEHFFSCQRTRWCSSGFLLTHC
jgi:hypothetical protein